MMKNILAGQMKNEEYREVREQNANRAKMLFDLRYAWETKESEISFFSEGGAISGSAGAGSCAKREKDIKIR